MSNQQDNPTSIVYEISNSSIATWETTCASAPKSQYLRRKSYLSRYIYWLHSSITYFYLSLNTKLYQSFAMTIGFDEAQ